MPRPKNASLRLFQLAAASADISLANCIFSDDRTHNVQMALKAGFGGVILHPKNVEWGAEYVARLLTMAGFLPADRSESF